MDIEWHDNKASKEASASAFRFTFIIIFIIFIAAGSTGQGFNPLILICLVIMVLVLVIVWGSLSGKGPMKVGISDVSLHTVYRSAFTADEETHEYRWNDIKEATIIAQKGFTTYKLTKFNEEQEIPIYFIEPVNAHRINRMLKKKKVELGFV